MIRHIIAGLLLAFAAAGCTAGNEPIDADQDEDIDSTDQAATVGEPCGGFAGFACDKGLYCKYEIEDHCGDSDIFGTCAEPTVACQWVYNPVCGCDGVTYSNACVAAANSMSVAHTGACK